jgi:hypothetical protein
MIPRGTTFEFEDLGEFEIEIKNILEHESEAQMELIHEKKTRGQKSRATVPLKIINILQFFNDNMWKKAVHFRGSVLF